jgi:hypothetical protein
LYRQCRRRRHLQHVREPEESSKLPTCCSRLQSQAAACACCQQTVVEQKSIPALCTFRRGFAAAELESPALYGAPNIRSSSSSSTA